MTNKQTDKSLEEALKDFAEYCHKEYTGTQLVNGEWEYGYKSEVITMAEKYLSLKEAHE